MLAVAARLPGKATTRPSVVLIHGSANSAGVWRYWLDGLAERSWPAFAIDLRGHGASERAGASRDEAPVPWPTSVAAPRPTA